MTVRIALASLFIVPAAMAYRWPSTADRWLLGGAVVAVLVLFAGWRGLFFTTMVWRRLAIWSRRYRTDGLHHSPVDYSTVVLRIDPSEPVALPLRLIAGYLDRYGIRCDKIRVTSRDLDGLRTTWISLTLRAVDNLTALRARSARIPLRETTDVIGRRDRRSSPRDGREHHSSRRGRCPRATRREGDLARPSRFVRLRRRLSRRRRFAEVRALPSSEIWTALEMTGTADDLRTAAACAIRTHDKPEAPAGATPMNGRHRPALDALSPMSVERLT